MPTERSVTISLDSFLGRFRVALNDDMVNLRSALRSIEDGSVLERARVARPGAVMQLQLDASRSAGPAAAGELCNRCFLNLVRSLVTFLDLVIAVRRCMQNKITLAEPIRSLQDLADLIERSIDQAYQGVARDRVLSNPAKLEQFPAMPELPRRAAQSYLKLRQCLEHHGGLPRTEIRLYGMTLTLLAGDREITSTPFVAEKGTVISVRTDDLIAILPAGARVSLTEAQVESVFLALQQWVGPAIVGAL